MTKHANAPVSIRQVGNGFIVTPDTCVDRFEATLYSDTMVFQTKAALFMWLDEHFSHRCASVEVDYVPTGDLASAGSSEKPGADGRP